MITMGTDIEAILTVSPTFKSSSTLLTNNNTVLIFESDEKGKCGKGEIRIRKLIRLQASNFN